MSVIVEPTAWGSLKEFISQLPVSDIRHKDYFELLHKIEDLEDEMRVVQCLSS